MAPAWQALDYRPLYELIRTRTGLTVSDTKSDHVERVIRDTLTSGRAANYQDLLLALAREPQNHPLWQDFIDVVTIGETYFFRNMYQLDALRSAVLPALIDARRKAGQQYLRLWSAGCATGEEPYSLAMLLRDLLPDIETWSINILGADLNATSLARARSGLYRAWSFRSETPGNIRERWFRPAADGYELSQTIRDMVTFAPLNLVTDDYPSFATGTMNMDVIVCRNVTIYFDQAMTREVVGRFQRALTDDGWLVVGHAEPQAALYEDRFAPRNFDNAVLYQKRRQGETALQEPCITVSTLPLPTPRPDLVQERIRQLTPKATGPEPELLDLDREPPDALQLAKQAADGENWDEALRWLAEAERKNRLHPHVHYLRGLVHLQSGSLEHAVSALRQAIYCDPDFALAHYSLAELYLRRGEVKAAIRHLRLAQTAILGLQPGCPLAFSDDLTVEMFQDLLTYRWKTLPGSPAGGSDVDL